MNITLSVRDIIRAIDIHRLYGFSFWDSLINRMAQKTSCTLLCSEDMQHEQQLGELKVATPFITI